MGRRHAAWTSGYEALIIIGIIVEFVACYLAFQYIISLDWGESSSWKINLPDAAKGMYI